MNKNLLVTIIAMVSCQRKLAFVGQFTVPKKIRSTYDICKVRFANILRIFAGAANT